MATHMAWGPSRWGHLDYPNSTFDSYAGQQRERTPCRSGYSAPRPPRRTIIIPQCPTGAAVPKTWICSVVSVCTRPILLTSCSRIQNMDMPCNMEKSSQQTSWGSNARTRLHQAAGVSCGMLGGCSAAVWTPCNGCSEREWEFFSLSERVGADVSGASRCAAGDGDGARSSGLARWKASRSAHRIVGGAWAALDGGCAAWRGRLNTSG